MLRDRCPVCAVCNVGVLSRGPDDIVLDGYPAPHTDRGTSASTFRPMSIEAKRSPISATAEHLLRNASGHTDIETR